MSSSLWARAPESQDRDRKPKLRGIVHLGSETLPRQQSAASPSSCSLIDAASMQRVNAEGYALMLNSTATDIGPDWDIVLTNPPDYPELGAKGCVVSQMLLQLTQPPNCTSTPVQAVTAVATGGGRVVLSYDAGTTSATRTVVSQTAAFPVAQTVTGQVIFPELHPSFSIPMSNTIFNNSLDATTSSSNNNGSISHVQATANLGQTCSLSLMNLSCTAVAQGTLQIAYEGFLWFNYHTPHTQAGANDTHYRWAENVTDILPLELRSTYMTVSATISSHGLVHDGEPNCLNALPADTVSPSQSPKSVQPYKYAVPIVAVALVLVCAAALYWTLQRRRRTQSSREGLTTPFLTHMRRKGKAIFFQDTAPSKPALLGIEKPPAREAQLPVYSQVA